MWHICPRICSFLPYTYLAYQCKSEMHLSCLSVHNQSLHLPASHGIQWIVWSP